MEITALVINLERSVERRESMKRKILALCAKSNDEIEFVCDFAPNAENPADYAENTAQDSTIPRDSINAQDSTQSAHNSADFTKESVRDSTARDSHAPKHKVRFTFLKATDRNDLDTLQIAQYRPLVVKLIRGKELNGGEVACFHSHYRAWCECVRRGTPIIVLEDDVLFTDAFSAPPHLAKIIESPYDFVRLLYLFPRGLQSLGGGFAVSFGNLSGTQGYFLRPRAAKKLIAKAKIFLHCVDNYMDMGFIHGVFNIAYEPFLINIDEAFSDTSTIQARKTPIAPGFKISREIARLVLFWIWRPLYIATHILAIRHLRQK